MLNVLEYIKTLDNFEANKPTIVIAGCNTIETYYNYYIKDSLLFIVFQQATDTGSGAYMNLGIINPDAITSIYCNPNLNVNVSDVSSNAGTYGEAFASTIKTIIPNFVTGKNTNNFNIGYNKARISVGSEIIRILDKNVAENGDFLSIDTNEISVGNIVGQPGNIMIKDTRFFTEYSKIDALFIPLIDVPMTPINDIISDDIKTLIENYQYNLFHAKNAPGYRHVPYNKGDRVWIDVTDKSKGLSETRRYFVSKLDKNSYIPLSKESKENDAWLECDSAFKTEITA